MRLQETTLDMLDQAIDAGGLVVEEFEKRPDQSLSAFEARKVFGLISLQLSLLQAISLTLRIEHRLSKKEDIEI